MRAGVCQRGRRTACNTLLRASETVSYHACLFLSVRCRWGGTHCLSWREKVFSLLVQAATEESRNGEERARVAQHMEQSHLAIEALHQELGALRQQKSECDAANQASEEDNEVSRAGHRQAFARMIGVAMHLTHKEIAMPGGRAMDGSA